MTKRLAATVLCVLEVCACATPKAQLPSSKLFAEATPLCVILGNPKSYVGKQLLVRGYLTQNPHRSEFWDNECERGFLPVKPSVGTAQDRQLRSKVGIYMAQSDRRPPQVPVVYSGTFTDNSPALICDGLCSQFTLEGAEVVAVRRD